MYILDLSPPAWLAINYRAIDPLLFSLHFHGKKNITWRVPGGLPDRQWKTRENDLMNIPSHCIELFHFSDTFDKWKNDNTLSTIVLKKMWINGYINSILQCWPPAWCPTAPPPHLQTTRFGARSADLGHRRIICKWCWSPMIRINE